MCISTGMSSMLIRPLMLTSLNIIRLLQSSRLGFSARYAFQCARRIFCNWITSSSGGYLTMSLVKSGFPSGCKIRPIRFQSLISNFACVSSHNNSREEIRLNFKEVDLILFFIKITHEQTN